MIQRVIYHIQQTAQVPSFSSFEERLHPYIRYVFERIPAAKEIEVSGNNLIFQLGDDPQKSTVAIAAHLDKINHYGVTYPNILPVAVANNFIEGAMDDCAGLGLILALAETSRDQEKNFPNLLFYFSEMEESKGLKEHPELLKNDGIGYKHGMGAQCISTRCKELKLIPKQVITVDTTPLFKGKKGIALYSKHWELNGLEPTKSLINKTANVRSKFLSIDENIKFDNNTNDYLHYGAEFNTGTDQDVVSIALEPAVFPYHQKGERVFIDDVHCTFNTLVTYLKEE